MADVKLAAIDLNLLVALDALLEERNVTRAARRVGLSQSAMSHTLTRLRTLLGDPLLVRTAGEMSATARGKELAGPIREALARIDRALNQRAVFEPATARRSFTVAAIDFAQLVLIPPLVARLSREAPGIELVVVSAREDLERALAAGSLDLSIGLARDLPGLHEATILRERFVCVVRMGHPRVRKTLTLKQFTELQHVMISPRGKTPGAVDRALERMGQSRRVAFTVPHFLAAALAVAGSDLVLTVAERVARTFADALPLRVLDPPIALEGFRVAQAWHARQHDDPAHAWLRAAVQDSAGPAPAT
jgi:DNA-binding transcriptional LysR family regulator